MTIWSSRCSACLIALLIFFPRVLLADEHTPLRVQLQWSHQAQFAGFYVAEERGHFEAEGLKVEIIPGGPSTDPLNSLIDGESDVAVTWLANSWRHHLAGDPPVVNVAQILSRPSLAVICRLSEGVLRPSDILDREIGIWDTAGDSVIVEEMLRRAGIATDRVTLTPQRPNGVDLIEGKFPCATAMEYNEYYALLRAGIPAADLLIIRPAAFDIHVPEDGLYVNAAHLEDEERMDQIVRLVSALNRGWQEAAIAPTLAVEAVMRRDPTLDRDQQYFMLETILDRVTQGPEFGLLRLDHFSSGWEVLTSHTTPHSASTPIWTHSVWQQMQKNAGNSPPLTEATRHYLVEITSSTTFIIFVIIGSLTFALSGILEAINRGYDLWGRLVLGALSGIGGGTLRDLIIGEPRRPLYYLDDLTLPLGILLLVLLATGIVRLRPQLPQSKIFKITKDFTDIIGFGALAIAGAAITIGAGLNWLWAPIMAAITCAGGGVLRSIVVNQEPPTFKGRIYEESAIIGAVVFLIGLSVANQFEHTAQPVLIAVLSGVFATIAVQLVVYHYKITYPGLKHKAATDAR